MPGDSSSTTAVVRRVLHAPPGTVFRVWTDPVFAARWSWGKAFTTVSASIDCRVGGRWRQQVRHKESGELWSFDGVIREVVPDAKLVHTFHWRSDRGTDEGTSLVSIEFRPSGPHTEVVITHTELSNADHRARTSQGWEDVLQSVDAALPKP